MHHHWSSSAVTKTNEIIRGANTVALATLHRFPLISATRRADSISTRAAVFRKRAVLSQGLLRVTWTRMCCTWYMYTCRRIFCFLTAGRFVLFFYFTYPGKFEILICFFFSMRCWGALIFIFVFFEPARLAVHECEKKSWDWFLYLFMLLVCLIKKYWKIFLKKNLGLQRKKTHFQHLIF